MGLCRAVAAWRRAAVAICLLPVALPLALLWLPPLSLALAVVRFRHRRRTMMKTDATAMGAGCCLGGGRSSPLPPPPPEREAGALLLLHKYLEDQLELVAADAGRAAMAAAALARN
ncbi:uncharacterized protein LOC112272318 [Brachypodium distachyon]|uniref:Uncharacterized protein n=1 Tax=Brachypodium distachyon TaxID=15368 RepID=I1IN22_BRADI|nr:uncharacterized protein LOC112272318 [Brachypodium distachyon]KQJ89197.1 hypothetical protein BRADI_4g24140v3 [Brachypodium distachyon]|eukprot:XP_024318517.1 uncharacterized protein LOC112272318 [Brachypodium distachyon]